MAIPADCTFDTDRDRLDMPWILASIRTTYWAANRPPDLIERSWTHSTIVAGVYYQGRQIGCARVVSDMAIASYLSDVFIDPAHRGRGIGRWMVANLLDHPDLRGTRWMLHTRDAHGVYAPFGFEQIGEFVMERPRPKGNGDENAATEQVE